MEGRLYGACVSPFLGACSVTDLDIDRSPLPEARIRQNSDHSFSAWRSAVAKAASQDSTSTDGNDTQDGCTV